jgi:hypothetical protein
LIALEEKGLKPRCEKHTYAREFDGLKDINLSCTRFRRHQVRCFMEQEVCHGEAAVYPRVQA